MICRQPLKVSIITGYDIVHLSGCVDRECHTHFHYCLLLLQSLPVVSLRLERRAPATRGAGAQLFGLLSAVPSIATKTRQHKRHSVQLGRYVTS